LVNEGRGRRLKRSATYVRFSLDAATRATHHQLHRRDDFDTIVENLRTLASADGPCTVGTGSVINERNVPEVHEGARPVKESGADYIQLKTYSGMPIPECLHARMLEQIERTLLLSDERFDVHVADRLFDNHTFQVRGYSRCHFHAMKTVINADGSVYLCAQKRTDPDGRIGNVLHASLREIWDSTHRKRAVDGLDLVNCPWCVHDRQNKMIEFMSGFQAPHAGFF